MIKETIFMLLLTAFMAWESNKYKPKPYPLGNGDTLMVRIKGNEFCPQYCEIDHFHFGHKKEYICMVDSCTHIIYEDKFN